MKRGLKQALVTLVLYGTSVDRNRVAWVEKALRDGECELGEKIGSGVAPLSMEAGIFGESPALNTKMEESFFFMVDDRRHAMEGTTGPKVS